jgi:cytochrome c oxidase subunit II
MLAEAPLQFLTGAGSRAYPVVQLTWVVLAISVAVTLIIGLLVLIACLKRNSPAEPEPDGRQPVGREGSGLAWIYVGTGLSTVVLLAVSVWTMITLTAVAKPPNQPALTIEVSGHQWWWEALYVSKEPSKVFRTANDIHIPLGQPVQVNLTGADVIHSFWVPALSGKMDTIPGQTNTMWLEADKPGVYRGQCTEYCGEQHAHMGFTLTADPPDVFKAWLAHQLDPAPEPRNEAIAKGEAVFITRCGVCHTVRGTDAGGRVGPDLSHLMQRASLAAGTLGNNPVQLSAWIADPQHIKPGNLMPRPDISGPELASIRTYLETLN